MYVVKHINAAGSKITVDTSAKSIYDLINTAVVAGGGTAQDDAGFDHKCNAINIHAEDGDIRYLMDGNTPTSALGFLVKSGAVAYLRGVPIKAMKLIRVNGTGVCSVEIGRSELYESSSYSTPPSSSSITVTAETEFPAASAASDNYANPTTTDVKSFNMVWDGATWDRAPGTAADGLLVNLGANNDVRPMGVSASLSNVASSASNVTLLASNANRKGGTFFNDSTQVLYLKFGATASATSFTVKLAAGAYYELPPAVVYTGIIDGIWASADGNCRITELT